MRSIDFFGTIGPACSAVETLVALINAGMTGVRINNSHSRLVDCKKYIEAIRRAMELAGKLQKVLMDLQGSELRICSLTEPFLLKAHEAVQIVSQQASGKKQVPVPKELFEALQKSLVPLLLDDGLIRLEPVSNAGEYLEYRAQNDCVIRPHKSISCDIEVELPIICEADRLDLEFAKETGIIYGVMVPFVQKADDVIYVRDVLKSIGADNFKIYAKIESRVGVENINSIIPHCDYVVIARGDLGMHIPLFDIPKTQKHIANACNAQGREFLVVTQMLHSMLSQPVPTRAEVCDIYNAICDGASALMLTGETAIGKYPVDSMKYLVSTANTALE